MTKKLTEEQFLDAYHKALSWAERRVDEQTEKGENAHTSIPDMFPHGFADLSFMIHTKAARLLGYEITEHYAESVEEARDLINYAAFYIALYHGDETS